MKEQAQLREEMAYQYKIGNFEVRKSKSLLCNFQLGCKIIDNLRFLMFRLQLLFREGWTQMLPCKTGGDIVGIRLLSLYVHLKYMMCLWIPTCININSENLVHLDSSIREMSISTLCSGYSTILRLDSTWFLLCYIY